MSTDNEALWLDSPRAALRTGPAPRPRPGAGEVVVRTAAVAVNPVDTMSAVQRRVVYPWLRFPAVLGTDVAGVVEEVGPGVTQLAVGDRVTGLATGQERHRNSPAHGAFQRQVLLAAGMTTTVPAGTDLAEAVVLPLAVATAAAGLFEPGQLGLPLPGRQPAARTDGKQPSVVVWGGSTSVGANAIQLARAAGFRVVATASPHNHPLLLQLGASLVLDYHDPAVLSRIRDGLAGHQLAGVLAIGSGSLPRALRIAVGSGGRRVAAASPSPVTTALGLLARTRGVAVSAIWGGTVARDDIGPSVFAGFLPEALAGGRYRPAPPAEVVGEGLAAVPDALERLRHGVSARKLVLTISS